MFLGQESRNPRNRAFPLFDISPRVPSLAAGTLVNITGSGSAIENPGKALSIQEAGTSTTQIRGLAFPAPPATPYRVSLLLSMSSLIVGTCSLGWGWYNPGSGKVETVQLGASLILSNNLLSFQYDTWSAATTRNGFSNISLLYYPDWSAVWCGLRNNGTNLFWEISADGANYVTVYTETIAASYLGSGNLSDVFFGLTDFGGNHAMALTCLCLDPNGLNRVAGC